MTVRNDKDLQDGFPVEPSQEPQGLSYTKITTEDQARILEERIRQLEAEHFNHSVNLQLGESTGSAEVVEVSKRAMVTIEAVHAQVIEQLKAL